MLVQFHCPSCKKLMGSDTPGKKCLCPSCGQKVLIPSGPPPLPPNETKLGILPVGSIRADGTTEVEVVDDPLRKRKPKKQFQSNTENERNAGITAMCCGVLVVCAGFVLGVTENRIPATQFTNEITYHAPSKILALLVIGALVALMVFLVWWICQPKHIRDKWKKQREVDQENAAKLRDLPERLKYLGDLRGLTEGDIVDEVGPPQARSAAAGGKVPFCSGPTDAITSGCYLRAESVKASFKSFPPNQVPAFSLELLRARCVS